MNHNGSSQALTARSLRASHPRQRVDLLRQALRTRSIDLGGVALDLDDWIQLFYASDDPALLVLLLELLASIADERVVRVARAARRHRGDGVRLEAIRLILGRHPEETLRLAREHRRDRSLEVQLLLAERLFAVHRDDAIDFFFEIFEAERDGPREGHALERGVEFLAESAADATVMARLSSIEPDFDDPEGFLAWGIEQMKRRLA